MLGSISIDGGSSTGRPSAVADQYVFSPRYVDSPILDTQTVATYSTSLTSWSSATSTYYFLTDANNNVTAITDDSGAVIERYVYSAYGSVTIYAPNYASTYSASTVGNTVLFAGMWFDPQTGFAYARARWFSPVVNGALTQDPAQQGTNWVAYANADPTNETDPTGLEGQSWSVQSNPCFTASAAANTLPARMYIKTSTGVDVYAYDLDRGYVLASPDGLPGVAMGQTASNSDSSPHYVISDAEMQAAAANRAARRPFGGPSLWETYQIGTRLGGIVQAGVGVLEVVWAQGMLAASAAVEYISAGLATPETFAVAGAAVALGGHGLDDIGTGATTAVSGALRPSL